MRASARVLEHRRSSAVLLTTLMLSVAMAACSSGSDDSSSTTTALPTTTSSTVPPPVVITKVDAAHGTILADPNGHTLYTLTDNRGVARLHAKGGHEFSIVPQRVPEGFG